MATGVKPRDEDIQITRSDLDVIQDALKKKKFRDMLADYCDEIRDPANQALYQKEMTQLEKERGYDITFINPKGGYVIKTSVAGDQKAFINICSNENVAKPSCNSEVVDGRRGLNWQIPYSMIPPRYDYDNKRVRCVIYDVVFHPDTLRMAEVNQRFRELVNKTAFDGLRKTYNIHLDDNNCRFPRSQYKGANAQAVIRKEDPNFVPPSDEDIENFTPEMMEKLYPQKLYDNKDTKPCENQPPKSEKRKKTNAEFNHALQNGFTVPKYIIKQQKNVDLQDYTYNKDCKQYSAIPSQIVVEINLPLLSSTEHCILDVQEKSLSLKSEKPAKYKLNIDLPYTVNDECGSAKFDKSKHMLIVTLPVVNRELNQNKPLRVDSGVESEENSGSQSDEDHKEDLIVEIPQTPTQVSPVLSPKRSPTNKDAFLDSTLAYTLPSYTQNVLDDIVAFTFHVKNTEPDSVKVKKDGNRIFIKFTTIGSGFVPVHYAAIIVLDESVSFENVTGEAWDNNVILQLDLTGDAPQKFFIGLDLDNLSCEYFDASNVKKGEKEETLAAEEEEAQVPLVEVTNLGSQTNIVVSTGNSDYDEDDYESSTPRDNENDNDNVFSYTPSSEHGAKSILRNGSYVGDVASSMDYISSDCVPEESSLKKTVRFNNVIAKQFYRYNSSIEGQKKKNQKKKLKKRQLEQRKSESEAEEDFTNNNSPKTSRSKLKSALKIRRDSGLADTSDADETKNNTPNDFKNNIENDKREAKETMKSLLNIVDNDNDEAELDLKESSSKKTQRNSDPITCDSIKHRTDLYDPNNLNKGQYLEVSFKNDLIFDLDM